MANTSIVSRLALHATAETSIPTTPASGTNITAAAWGTAGFDTIGGRGFRLDDYNVNDNSWSFGTEYVTHRVKAPISQGVEDEILISAEIGDFEIEFYDMDVNLLAFGSDMTLVSDTITHASSFTPRTLAIEIHKLGIWRFPKVIIKFTNFEMGAVDQVAIATATITPLSTSSLPMGMSYEKY